jgi:PAS domain-containing protein
MDDRRSSANLSFLNREQGVHEFRTLLEAAPDAMVIGDADGKISLVNAHT